MSIAQSLSELAQQTVWSVDRIKDHVWKIGSGITPSGGAASYLDTGIPLLRSQNVHFDGLRLNDVAYIDEETHDEMSSTKLRWHDVLLEHSRSNQSLSAWPMVLVRGMSTNMCVSSVQRRNSITSS